MPFLIRRARHADSPQIIASHARSIREVCAQDYTPEQIEAWAGRKRAPDFWCPIMDREFVWVIEVDSIVRGFACFKIENKVGEVNAFYFAPEARNLGAGKKLFEFIFKVAQENDLQEIKVYSTLNAKSFYESLGFQLADGKTEMEMSGVKIPCIPMKKFVTS